MASGATLLRQRKVLAEFGELALVSDDLEFILDEACRLVGEALETNLAKFMLLLDDGVTFLVRNGTGWTPDVVGQVRVEAREGTPEYFSLNSNAPVISADIATETRFHYHAFQKENGVKAFVNVLVYGATEQRPFGIFEVDSRSPRQFTDSDIDFLRVYSNLIGAVLKRAKTLQAMRSTEKLLRESDRHYRIAAELNPQWPWTADNTGELTSIDRRWYEFTGLTSAQTLGRQWTKAAHAEDQQSLATLWDESLATLEPFDSKVRLRQHSGEHVWFRIRALCSFDAAGHSGQWYGTIENIDKHVQLEGALRDWNVLLEDRIAQRTAQLEAEQQERAAAESKLRQSQKMEAVGQLTGGIAHDFNNLLAGIIGSLELMQRRIDTGRYNELGRYNATARASASRAAALTQRLLAFSRQQSLRPELLEPRAVVAGLEEMIRRSVGPSIVVETSLRTSSRIRCDLNQLENALLNLSLNARDAMPDGGTLGLAVDRCLIDQTLSSDKNMAPGAYVSLAVTDSGTGISPDILSRIFDPFFTTKKIGEGTGLGLSMIYGFTQQSGGQVRVHSTLGIGTTVTLYFPVDESPPVEKPAHSSVLPQQESRGHHETILLVDDEATVRQMASEFLTETGYDVAEAADSVSALKQLEKLDHLELLLTDIGLPGAMNGINLAAAFRLKFPRLKVLFITGFAGGSGLVAVDEHTQLLTKPFSLVDLGQRVQQLVQASSAAD
ncbi:ATP-binding protein [Pseudomonas sp. 14P_8.1_Bac3]|uniref:ATP-binding protein n=1 Tax=Pseudomonas sp. 14P_8.1_Bac3 TaxID=2971621 RepID=UPI0021C6A6DE|nr:ATP-binding protein [Pseudomonas sp. 14P_8.1_Bac3]MCU1763205.1 ATP-binding protein [Pseudomonas sp. 14P_8.1_Bac3]